jgi:hypothetical protein
LVNRKWPLFEKPPKKLPRLKIQIIDLLPRKTSLQLTFHLRFDVVWDLGLSRLRQRSPILHVTFCKKHQPDEVWSLLSAVSYFTTSQQVQIPPAKGKEESIRCQSLAQ